MERTEQLAISTGQTYVRQMITFAMANGSMDLATKRRIEASPEKTDGCDRTQASTGRE